MVMAQHKSAMCEQSQMPFLIFQVKIHFLSEFPGEECMCVCVCTCTCWKVISETVPLKGWGRS
jgi:hypothetical protein